MIIKDLAKAYDYLAKDPNREIIRDGFAFEEIAILLVINEDGELLEIIENNIEGREKVPENAKKNTVEAWYLIDTVEYILGLESSTDTVTKAKSYKESFGGRSGKSISKFSVFKKDNLELLKDVHSPAAMAIKAFLNSWTPVENQRNEKLYVWDTKGKSKPKIAKNKKCAFALNSVANKTYKDSDIINAWKEHYREKQSESVEAICSISGIKGKISKNHREISMSGPAGKSANLISVDKASSSYQSYNKKECYNSPVSENVMHKYTSALNYFYRKGSKNKTNMGKDALIFWAESSNDGYQEELLSLLAMEPTQSAEEAVEKNVSASLSQMKKGISPDNFKTADGMLFHILIIAPNPGRLTIEKYFTMTFGKLKRNIFQHHEDMSIVNSKGEVVPYPLWQVLDSTVPSVITQDRSARINPNNSGGFSEAVFNNKGYPYGLFAEMILRIKTDNPSETSSEKARKNYKYAYPKRIAFIKAYLNRNNRIKNIKEDIKVSLNLENRDEAYLLGRLFAVMEKVQSEALGNPNSTIKDRFFASACSTPSTVFPSLIKGYHYHIKKDGVRRRVYYERLIGEILSGFEKGGFPKHLDLDGQGRFILGYYQQNTALWTKQNKDENNKIKEEI